jgi:UDP-N-acetylmuramate dehydrogenase
LDKKAIVDYFTEVAGEENVLIDEPMRNHTSFKLGGPADVLVTPRNKEQLVLILNYCNKNSVPFYVIGNGSNLIVRDKGIRGAVIKLFNNYNNIIVEDDVICVEAGALLSRLANTACENNLTGLEFAHGIPGTVGGAVTMNAGAYGGEMKDVVFKTEFIDKNGEIVTLNGEEHEFSYRNSYIQKHQGIVTRSWMKLQRGNKEEIQAKMDDLMKRRKDKQPLEMPSAGSVFKRPEGYFAGKLIEDCGLRGVKIGGAQVSEKHCGFIVNTGNATTQDVLDLIATIQDKVKDKFNVEMHTEVRIIGEE